MTKKRARERYKEDAISRRRFFYRIWRVLGIVALFEIVVIFFAFLFSGRKRSGRTNLSQVKVIGRLDDFEPGTVYPYRSGQLYLVRMLDGGFLALSLKCTHLGCSVRWIEDEQKFVCPCHASQFDRKGNVLNPPAPRALDIFDVFLEDGLLKVDLNKKIKRKFFEPSQLTYV